MRSNAATDSITLVHKLREWSTRTPDAPAVWGRGKDGWAATSWRRYDELARTVGKGLLTLGHRPGEAVALVGRNRPEWLFAEMGILTAAGVPAPSYTTNTAAQVAYVFRHCKARVAVVEDKEQYAKLVAERASLGAIEKVVLMDDVLDRDKTWTMLWPELLALGEKGDAAALEARLAAAKPDDLAFLCYTSGTTGQAKAVMLSHRNLTHSARVGVERFAIRGEKIISYLPLCHMAEQFFTTMAQVEAGNEVFMCDDLAKVKDYLPEIRPTIFLGVPRVWEKLEAALRARLGEATGVKAKLAKWALATELAAFKRDVETGAASGGIARWFARKLVISKIKAKLGLDRVKYAFSGAAPISPRTQELFASLGLPIYEGYGMSETSALLTTSMPGRPRFGTVGRALEGVELKLADDGEILARGPNLTKGYLDDKAQTDALWEGGWLHTGDVGVIDAEGNLKITDRKKELFKTSGGKYIAPQMLEGRLKAIRGVSQAVAVGDNRKYVAALLTLDPENAPKVAAELGIVPADVTSLATNDRFKAHIEARVEAECNAGLARYEQVKRVGILPADFSVAGGEMTPTMKLKRKIIAEKHAAAIEALFTNEASVAG